MTHEYDGINTYPSFCYFLNFSQMFSAFFLNKIKQLSIVATCNKYSQISGAGAVPVWYMAVSSVCTSTAQ